MSPHNDDEEQQAFLDQRKAGWIDWIQSKKTKAGTPFIAGLDTVIYGRQAAADAVYLFGGQPPRYLWYMLSGFGCDIIQFHIDLMLHYGFGLEDASVCWALGFFASIVFRHSFHRYLVFGTCCRVG